MQIKELKIMSLCIPIENSLWHARMGIFKLNRTYSKKIKVPRFPLTNFHFSVLFFQFLFFIIKLFFRLKLPKLLLLIDYILVITLLIFNLHNLLLLQSGDIEINPGPMKSSRLNFCHWNFNGIATHDFVKVPLIEAFIKTIRNIFRFNIHTQ